MKSNFHIISGRRSIFISIISVLALMAPEILTAQGDLLITPRRIVFEDNKNRQEITLANTGRDTSRYTISFVQYRMTEVGGFEQITEPDSGQYFADPYLRYFPRTVVLAPQESQVIRMQLRRTPGMNEAEYRSHMYFRAVPEERPLGEEDLLEDTTAIGIRLTPIFGITIPVIIRVGDLDLNVSIEDVNLEDRDGKKFLSLNILRDGEKSVFGDLIVEHISPEGEKSELGIVRGIAVYTPNRNRRFTFELRQIEDADLTKGKLVVRYISPSDTKPEVFGKTEIVLD